MCAHTHSWILLDRYTHTVRHYDTHTHTHVLRDNSERWSDLWHTRVTMAHSAVSWAELKSVRTKR